MQNKFLNHLSGFTGYTLPELEKIWAQPAYRGIRLNPLKANFEILQSGFNVALEPTPFCQNAYYIPANYTGIGHHPLHHAGAFYVQEPSAGSAITAVAAQPGQRVLDLCAAPGGKSTGIAAALQGKGLLWSNEFVKSRTGALLSNLERFGISNAVFSNYSTEKLCAQLPGFFDTVLVDAPCSGEGMCRHNPEALQQWSLENIELCVPRQREILAAAVTALKVGGRLVYSTCTFNPKENEENVAWLLNTYGNLKIQNVNFNFGTPGLSSFDFSKNVCRIFPTNGGEGHFVAVFEKTAETEEKCPPALQTNENVTPKTKKLWQDFCKENLTKLPAGTLLEKNNRLYLLPTQMPQFSGPLLRAGLPVAEVKTNRLEPTHALFNTPFVQPLQVLNLPLEDSRLAAYLHGLEIPALGLQKGFVQVCVAGAPLGFGKFSGGVLKNHYPKGLRELN